MPGVGKPFLFFLTRVHALFGEGSLLNSLSESLGFASNNNLDFPDEGTEEDATLEVDPATAFKVTVKSENPKPEQKSSGSEASLPTAVTQRSEVVWLVDGVVKEAATSFEVCAKEDDEYDFPVLNRMQHQRRPVQKCIEREEVIGKAMLAGRVLAWLYGEVIN